MHFIDDPWHHYRPTVSQSLSALCYQTAADTFDTIHLSLFENDESD